MPKAVFTPAAAPRVYAAPQHQNRREVLRQAVPLGLRMPRLTKRGTPLRREAPVAQICRRGRRQKLKYFNFCDLRRAAVYGRRAAVYGRRAAGFAPPRRRTSAARTCRTIRRNVLTFNLNLPQNLAARQPV